MLNDHQKPEAENRYPVQNPYSSNLAGDVEIILIHDMDTRRVAWLRSFEMWLRNAQVIVAVTSYLNDTGYRAEYRELCTSAKHSSVLIFWS
jgi:hypothetical protein